MKNKNFLSENIMFSENRLIFAWSEVYNAPELVGEPNKVEYKNNEESTEDPETPEGRNVIRGQAILMLKRFQYESDSLNLNNLIGQSRRAELGLKEPGTEDIADKVSTARDLKIALDNFRETYTTTDSDGNLIFKEANKLTFDYEHLSSIREGRAKLMQKAMDWLKVNQKTEENADQWTGLKTALNELIRAENDKEQSADDRIGKADTLKSELVKVGAIGEKEASTPTPTPEETPEPTPEETPEPKAEETPEPKAEETPDPTPEETPAPKPEEAPTPVPTPIPTPVPKETPAPETPEVAEKELNAKLNTFLKDICLPKLKTMIFSENNDIEWDNDDAFHVEDGNIEANVNWTPLDEVIFTADELQQHNLTAEQVVNYLNDNKQAIRLSSFSQSITDVATKEVKDADFSVFMPMFLGRKGYSFDSPSLYEGRLFIAVSKNGKEVLSIGNNEKRSDLFVVFDKMEGKDFATSDNRPDGMSKYVTAGEVAKYLDAVDADFDQETE